MCGFLGGILGGIFSDGMLRRGYSLTFAQGADRGGPADIADAVALLASTRASYVTGETLHVTGGRY